MRDEYFLFEKLIVKISQCFPIDHYTITIWRLEKVTGRFQGDFVLLLLLFGCVGGAELEAGLGNVGLHIE